MRKQRFKPNALQNVIDFGFTPEPAEIRSPYPVKDMDREKVAIDPERPVIKFISLGSGSSGNCSYIGTQRGGILIDAGVKTDVAIPALEANGISMTDIKGILLTHDHHDHVSHVYKFLRTYRHLHLFCTNRVIKGIMQRHSISKRIMDYHVAIYKEIPFQILDFTITAFDVPHDGSDNMGFHISTGERSICVATDLGYVNERAAHYMEISDYLVIEANYDATMLRNGRYPEFLKARIRAENGHLDNADTASFLSRIMGRRLKHIFLCHLSKDNNTPQIALRTVTEALQGRGYSVGGDHDTSDDLSADVRVTVLPRYDATRLFVFRD